MLENRISARERLSFVAGTARRLSRGKRKRQMFGRGVLKPGSLAECRIPAGINLVSDSKR